MPRRVSPRRTRRLYLAEHRESRGLTQQQLADILDVTDMTVSRWEREASKLNTDVMAALAEVYRIEPEDLYYPPDALSPNALLRDQPKAIWEQAIAIIKAIRKPIP